MIRSMTGFGAAEARHDHWMVRVELRSVNHRDLQVSFRLPEAFHLRELELQRVVEAQVRRGHVRLVLSAQLDSGRTEVLVDTEHLRGYLLALKDLAGIEQTPVHVDLASLLRLPGALKDVTTDTSLREELWPVVKQVARDALAEMVGMRQTEGANLAGQLGQLCDDVESRLAGVEGCSGQLIAAYRDRLKERIEKLLAGTGVAVSEDSLAREVAFFAERSDVSEEVARLHSHLAQFREALDGDEEAVGRRMEFLGQEMLREANTMAAKMAACEQLATVMEIKGLVDRLREQVRNVE